MDIKGIEFDYVGIEFGFHKLLSKEDCFDEVLRFILGLPKVRLNIQR